MKITVFEHIDIEKSLLPIPDKAKEMLLYF